MHKEIAHYVVFWSPGSFFAESQVQPVDSADPKNVRWPDNAYSFTMHEREDVIDGDNRYEGKARQLGPTYYHPASRVETLAEVQRNPKASEILISNMKGNGWTHIVWTRWGTFPQPFKPSEMKILKA